MVCFHPEGLQVQWKNTLLAYLPCPRGCVVRSAATGGGSSAIDSCVLQSWSGRGRHNEYPDRFLVVNCVLSIASGVSGPIRASSPKGLFPHQSRIGACRIPGKHCADLEGLKVKVRVSTTCAPSLPLGVFGFGGEEDGNVGITVFPQREKILIGCATLRGVTLNPI
jgi:hypothetical protein